MTGRLRVDPVACDGIGQCALAAPDVVALDRWGYPILTGELRGSEVRTAGRAVAACPRAALWLQTDGPDASGSGAP